MVFTILISGICFTCNRFPPICSMIIAKIVIMHNSTPFVINLTFHRNTLPLYGISLIQESHFFHHKVLVMYTFSALNLNLCFCDLYPVSYVTKCHYFTMQRLSRIPAQNPFLQKCLVNNGAVCVCAWEGRTIKIITPCQAWIE